MQQQLKHSRLLQSGATSKVTPFNRFISGDIQLSEHFTLSEMCFSQTAAQHKPPVPNIPLKCHITALQNLAQRALEPIRQHLGLPIKVNSGYRCMMVNTMVGGAPTSQHTRGEAADITIVRSARPRVLS